MKRTQIQLPEDVYEELRDVSARTHRSMADCVREGVTLFLTGAKARTEEAPLAEIAGKFRPLADASPVKPHDQWWSDAVRPAVPEDGNA